MSEALSLVLMPMSAFVGALSARLSLACIVLPLCADCCAWNLEWAMFLSSEQVCQHSRARGALSRQADRAGPLEPLPGPLAAHGLPHLCAAGAVP